MKMPRRRLSDILGLVTILLLLLGLLGAILDQWFIALWLIALPLFGMALFTSYPDR